jgi:hypothetical protein
MATPCGSRLTCGSRETYRLRFCTMLQDDGSWVTLTAPYGLPQLQREQSLLRVSLHCSRESFRSSWVTLFTSRMSPNVLTFRMINAPGWAFLADGYRVGIHLAVFRIRISFNADPDPAVLFNSDPDADQDLDPGFWWPKIKKITAEKNSSYRRSLQLSIEEHPALQNLKFLPFFLFIWVIFALLDPDLDPADHN